jgi:hypothetical protein
MSSLKIVTKMIMLLRIINYKKRRDYSRRRCKIRIEKNIKQKKQKMKRLNIQEKEEENSLPSFGMRARKLEFSDVKN